MIWDRSERGHPGRQLRRREQVQRAAGTIRFDEISPHPYLVAHSLLRQSIDASGQSELGRDDYLGLDSAYIANDLGHSVAGSRLD
jgi:hypothetical protein